MVEVAVGTCTAVLDGMQAFMTGKLKLTGDMMFAQSMQAWFTS